MSLQLRILKPDEMKDGHAYLVVQVNGLGLREGNPKGGSEMLPAVLEEKISSEIARQIPIVGLSETITL